MQALNYYRLEIRYSPSVGNENDCNITSSLLYSTVMFGVELFSHASLSASPKVFFNSDTSLFVDLKSTFKYLRHPCHERLSSIDQLRNWHNFCIGTLICAAYYSQKTNAYSSSSCNVNSLVLFYKQFVNLLISQLSYPTIRNLAEKSLETLFYCYVKLATSSNYSYLSIDARETISKSIKESCLCISMTHLSSLKAISTTISPLLFSPYPISPTTISQSILFDTKIYLFYLINQNNPQLVSEVDEFIRDVFRAPLVLSNLINSLPNNILINFKYVVRFEYWTYFYFFLLIAAYRSMDKRDNLTLSIRNILLHLEPPPDLPDLISNAISNQTEWSQLVIGIFSTLNQEKIKKSTNLDYYERLRSLIEAKFQPNNSVSSKCVSLLASLFNSTIGPQQRIEFFIDCLEKYPTHTSVSAVLNRFDPDGFYPLKRVSEALSLLVKSLYLQSEINCCFFTDEKLDSHSFKKLIKLAMDNLLIPSFLCAEDLKENFVEHSSVAVDIFSVYFRICSYYFNAIAWALSRCHETEKLLEDSDDPIVIGPSQRTSSEFSLPGWMDLLNFSVICYGPYTGYEHPELSWSIYGLIDSINRFVAFQKIGSDIFELYFRRMLQRLRSGDCSKSLEYRSSIWVCTQFTYLTEEKKQPDPKYKIVSTVLCDTLSDFRIEIKLKAIDLILSMGQKCLCYFRYFPGDAFKKIIKSLAFRDKTLITRSLDTSLLILGSQLLSVKLDWATELMDMIVYEIEFLQDPVFLTIYMNFLKDGFIKLLEVEFLHYFRPLLHRVLMFLESGSMSLLNSSLDLIVCMIVHAWPVVESSAELIVGALCSVWIDKVHFTRNLSQESQPNTNVDVLHSKLVKCISFIFNIISPAMKEKILQELSSIEDIFELQKNLLDISKHDTPNHS